MNRKGDLEVKVPVMTKNTPLLLRVKVRMKLSERKLGGSDQPWSKAQEERPLYQKAIRSCVADWIEQEYAREEILDEEDSDHDRRGG